MHQAIEQHLPELQRLCERYGVEYRTLFGSGASGLQPRAKRHLFVGDVQGHGAGEVDLVTERSISNPDFRREIERENAVVYAA